MQRLQNFYSRNVFDINESMYIVDIYKELHRAPGVIDVLDVQLIPKVGGKYSDVSYDFGANLKELTFELGNEQFDSIAMSRITQAVETYMPFISLDNFEPFVDTEQTSQDLGIVGIRVKYSVPSVKLTNQCIEIILAVGG